VLDEKNTIVFAPSKLVAVVGAKVPDAVNV
jgi:hypothetical protein